MRRLSLMRIIALLAAGPLLASCGGIGGGFSPSPAPSPVPSGTSSVDFVFVVPPATSARRRTITAPSGAASVTIALLSVNGTAQTSSTTTEEFSTATGACQTANTDLACSFVLTAPVGSLVYSVEFYSGSGGSGTALGGGDLAVTTQSGEIANVSSTLGGTVATIALSVGSAELGSAASVPVTVQAQDAHGYTIFGSYTNPITLTDTDASSQTSLSASSVADSTAAAGVTLNYQGGAMSSPATISATATGVSGSNVKSATFTPDGTAPVAQGATITYTTSGTTATGNDGPPGTPSSITPQTYTATISNNASFNGLSGLVEVDGDTYLPSTVEIANGAIGEFLSSPSTSQEVFEQWVSQGPVAALQFVGALDPASGTQVMCTPPYQTLLELPLPSGWDVLSGSGPCSYEASSTFLGAGIGTSGTFDADGSYSVDLTVDAPGAAGTENITVEPSGAQSISENEGTLSAQLNVPPITTNASTVTVTEEQNGGSPTTMTASNPWLATGATASGAQPAQLASDTVTVAGSISSLPSQCAVPSSVLGANPSLSETVETIAVADPSSSMRPLYATSTIKHYYVAGIGEICNETVYAATALTGGSTSWFTSSPGSWSTYSSDVYTYVSAVTGLTADAVHAKRTLAAGAAALTASTYAAVVQRMLHPRTTTRSHLPSLTLLRR